MKTLSAPKPFDVANRDLKYIIREDDLEILLKSLHEQRRIGLEESMRADIKSHVFTGE